MLRSNSQPVALNEENFDYFCGFATAADADALNYFTTPDAPSNYKNPDAIAEYKQRARMAFLEKAAEQAITGTVNAVCVLDPQGRTVFASNSDDPGQTSLEFIDWINQVRFDEYPVSVSGSFTPRRRLWGFDIDTMLRIVGLEGMRYGDVNVIPLRFWYHNNGAYDPVDILTSGAERKMIALPGLFRYLDLTLDHGVMNNVVGSHTERAQAVRLLCQRTGLLHL